MNPSPPPELTTQNIVPYTTSFQTNFDKFQQMTSMNSTKSKTQLLPSIRQFPTIKEILTKHNSSSMYIIGEAKMDCKHDEESKKTPNENSNFLKIHNRNLNYIQKITNRNLICTKQIQMPAKERNETSMDRLNNIKKKFQIELGSSKEKTKRVPTPPVQNEIFYYYNIISGNNTNTIKKCMSHRLRWKEGQNFQEAQLMWSPLSTPIPFNQLDKNKQSFQVTNHFEFHKELSNKFYVFRNLMTYCESKTINVFNYIPMTIYIQYESANYLRQFSSFQHIFLHIEDYISKECKVKYKEYFYNNYLDRFGGKTNIIIPPNHYAGKNLWLIKAINLNRGRCIKITNSIESIEKIIKHFYQGVMRNFKESEKEEEEEEKKPLLLPQIRIVKKKKSKDSSNNKSPQKINYSICNNKTDKSKYQSSHLIIQKYIEKPLLYKGRKFDMRIWVLLTYKMEVYVFREGHLKAASLNYDIENLNLFIHLTNFSVQKYNENFSKFEHGNEISFEDFQNELNKEGKRNTMVKDELFPKVCEIIKLTMNSVKEKLNPFNRKFCFEIFGYDFMFDADYNPYLIEVNTNPGLEISSPLISSLVPRMIDDALRLTIDQVFKTEYLTEAFNFRYISPFPVKGYFNDDNLFIKICDLYLDDNKRRKKVND